MVVTSLVGELPTPKRSAYSASKHALHGFFEALRAEEFDNGVRVTLVLPGFIRTQVSVNALTADGGAQGSMTDLHANGMHPVHCTPRLVQAEPPGTDHAILFCPARARLYFPC